ncbi:MAG: hypothetical protein IKY01_11180 [Prevotella sp.]|nr:hypothetical protein [Prevotella sp.]
MKIDAKRSNNATRAVGLVDGELIARWLTTDVITVLDYHTNETLGTLTPQSEGVESALVGTLTAPASENTYLLIARSASATAIPGFDYTGQVGTMASLSKCDYSTAIIEAEEDDYIITANNSVQFNNEQAMVEFSLWNEYTNAVNVKKLTIDCYSGDKIKDGVIDGADSDMILCVNYDSTVTKKYTFGPLEINLAIANYVVKAAIKMGNTNETVKITAETEDGIYSFSKDNVTFEEGKYYSVTIEDMSKMASSRKTYGDPIVQVWE